MEHRHRPTRGGLNPDHPAPSGATKELKVEEPDRPAAHARPRTPQPRQAPKNAEIPIRQSPTVDQGSGGALALEAAAAGSAIDTIAVWEVPYAVGDDMRPRFEEYIADTRRAFDAGRDEEVLELFMRMTGASDDNIAARKAAGKQTAHWADSVALAPTLVHDSVFLNGYQLPADRLATVTQPVLVTTGGPITVPYMAGLPSDFFDRAADEIADLLPHAQRETLEGPDHVVDPQTIGPLLLRFFSSESPTTS